MDTKSESAAQGEFVMKHYNLEQKLEASRPDVSTRSAFTLQTMAVIRSTQATETFSKAICTTNATKKEHLFMKLRKKLPIYKQLKPAYLYASLMGVVVIGGTAAAIALWPAPKVTQTKEVPLPSGNRVVGYDTQNCNYFGELKSPANAPTYDVVYYEIRKDASLTDQQLGSSLQAVCEENLSNNAVSTLVKQVPKNTPGIQSTENYIIKAITGNSITIALDPHYSAGETPGKGTNVTLTHFVSNLLVYDESSQTNYSDLKVGDSVVMVIATIMKEGTSGAFAPFTDPNSVTIYGIMSVPPLTGDPGVFYMAVAKDLVRVDVCKANPNGFCETYNFADPNR